MAAVFVGQWNVYEVSGADGGAEEQSVLIIDAELKGSFRFAGHAGEVDGRVRRMQDLMLLEWTWRDLELNDCGRGFATVDAGVLRGTLFVHGGNDVTFAATLHPITNVAADARPYFNFGIAYLEALEGANQNDVVVLEAILRELEYRAARRRNVALRSRVEARLDELHEEAEAEFPYVDTDAEPGEGGLLADWPQVGLLAHVGYRVGRAGISEQERRRLLDFVYSAEELPRVNGGRYMEEWGAARTNARLKKLAESLAAFCRNQRRRDLRSGRESLAAMHWEADLEYLKQTYFREHFEWPRTDLQ